MKLFDIIFFIRYSFFKKAGKFRFMLYIVHEFKSETNIQIKGIR